MIKSEFQKFANSYGVSSMSLDAYARASRGYVNPTILVEKVNGVAVDIYSMLQTNRILFLGTSIDDDVANVIQAQLLYLASENDNDISLYINSGGGVVSSGYAILDTMNIIKPTVNTICTGMAASMAAVILSAGDKGKRSILPHGRVMIHQPLSGVDGQASDIIIKAEEIKRLRTELYEILANNTGQTIKKIEKDADRDFWMTAQKAIDYGIVDKILTKKESSNDDK